MCNSWKYHTICVISLFTRMSAYNTYFWKQRKMRSMHSKHLGTHVKLLFLVPFLQIVFFAFQSEISLCSSLAFSPSLASSKSSIFKGCTLWDMIAFFSASNCSLDFLSFCSSSSPCYKIIHVKLKYLLKFS